MKKPLELCQELDFLLEPGKFHDSSINGVQVEAPGDQETTLIATPVDAGESVIEAAISHGAQLLIVHHGLFWGKEHPVTGALSRKLALLLKNGCTLYTSHLPLDAHLIYGNNALLAKHFGVTEVKPFGEYRGAKIGIHGKFSSSVTINDIKLKAESLIGSSNNLILPFGPNVIGEVAIISGSGTDWLREAALSGIDTFITGEPKQSAYHEAKELGVNLICAGHYATETLGVRALGDELSKRHNIKHHFINEPTGI